MLAYSRTELAAVTSQAVMLEWKQAADVLNHCLAELDVFKVTKIEISINIGMFNAYSKSVAWLYAWKRGSITTPLDVK